MVIHNYFKRLLFVICNILFIISLSGQTQNSAYSDTSTSVPIGNLLNRVSQKHSIKFFYNPEWFIGKKFPIAISDLPLDECLLRIRRLSGYMCVTLDKSYVFVPFESALIKQTEHDNSSITVIGNLTEYGRYSKAIFSGKMIDGKSGEPLVGATFLIDKINIALTTDKNGAFSVIVPVGEYEVKCSYMGYENDVKKVKVVSNGSANIELFEKSVHLEEVVISAEKAESNVTRTQMSIVKLTSKTIKELPVSLGEKDIIKSFTLMPGIQSVGEFGTGFNVRGGGSDQNLILVEDVPLFNSSHIFGLTSSINPDNVVDATLLKAGIPAQYGERTSSLLDIHMGSTNTNTLRVKGGIGLLNSRLTVETPLLNNKMFVQLGGRTSYSDWLLQQMPDKDLMNSSASFYDVNGLLTYNINSHNKITLFAYRSNDKFGFGGTVNYLYSNRLASFKWNHFFSKKLSGSFMAGMSQYEYHKDEMDTMQLPYANKIKSLLDYYKIKFNINWLPTEAHNINIGIDAINYNVNPGTQIPDGALSIIKPLQIDKEKGAEFAFYISDDYSLSKKFNLELGLRCTDYMILGTANIYSYDPALPRSTTSITQVNSYGEGKIIQKYPKLEPRVSIKYSLNEVSSVKFSYNRINQFINLISNTAVMSPTDVWKLTDPNTKPLQCDQVALGYFKNFAQNKYETSIEIYYKDLKHIIDYKEGAKTLMNSAMELDLLDGKGYNYGSEVFIRKNAGSLTGWISYTYSVAERKTTSNFDAEQINNNHYYPASYDRPHNLVINANYHISRRWRISGSFSYATGRPETYPEYSYTNKGYDVVQWSARNKYRLPDYHRLDISVSLDESLRIKKKWKGNWTLSIINVYGRKNAYSAFYQKTTPLPTNNYKSYTYYKMYIIGNPLPTLTYNFTF